MQLDINTISEDYSKKNILVVGDIILDEYVYGKVDRISQEAPVPIVSIDRQEFKPGGAANVALNLSGLGAKVTLMCIVGKDTNHAELNQCFTMQDNINNQIIECDTRTTSIKPGSLQMEGRSQDWIVRSPKKFLMNIFLY